MIWSFVKIAVFLAIVGLLALIGARLADSTDGFRLIFAGTEYTFGPLQAVIAAIIVFLVIWLIIRVAGLLVAFLRFVNGDNTAIGRYFDQNRERKGYEALAEGMLAVASGEGKLALSKAARAERYLNRPELTNLLSAQAAEVAGDRTKAAEVYRRLLSDDRTRFVGVQGLMRQKLEEGDTATALKLAEKAYALKPSNVDVQDALLKLQAEKGNWKGAREVLSAKRWQGLLPKDVHRRRDAVMALQEAKGVFEEGATIEAREAAIAANKASPDLIPAAVMAAHAYIDEGKPKHASRVILKAWEAQPHPDLAAVYAAILPEETPEARLKRFGKLLALRPDHEETRLLDAELNIAAEDFPAARRALGDLVTTHPTARVLTIMAAIERGEGAADAVVRGWLTRALTAPRGPQWCCDKCQNIQSDWTPICENCGGFDTLSWREPVQSQMPLPNGAEMLPVIIGRPDATQPPDAAPEPAKDYAPEQVAEKN
ncbi:heme biosynthesis protein HemY [Paenirhodobacter populi]|uniref:Tetratricopeptide repeat protein n=1 Tax=Paenirhodobacter populi TaxID=2306993 RepID=A0A443JBA6_9RHOB|nr:heme biosynthesis HemY N-terminal domain-containing protein [Sinirhodobacter populi]RWR11250.1 tetratricopeptide repeat protein [Sinirhodobacter populi]RWR17829.1 tetratricopeptide repeat protein [Sinirhodobacter populi]